jgi:hypothetical protein
LVPGGHHIQYEEAGEGFAATCSEEEAVELVQSFFETATQVIEMIPVDMS